MTDSALPESNAGDNALHAIKRTTLPVESDTPSGCIVVDLQPLSCLKAVLELGDGRDVAEISISRGCLGWSEIMRDRRIKRQINTAEIVEGTDWRDTRRLSELERTLMFASSIFLE